MDKQFSVKYNKRNVDIVLHGPDGRFKHGRSIEVHNCVDVERGDLESVLDSGQIDWLRNPTRLVDHILKAVATAPNNLVSLGEIRRTLEADIKPAELDRLTTQVMEDLYPANEFDWEPDLLGQAIDLIVGLLDHMERLQPVVDMALNPGDVGSSKIVGARLTRIGQVLKELAFGTSFRVTLWRDPIDNQ